MNTLKKIIGLFSLVIGPILLATLIYRAIHEFAVAKPAQLSELYVFWPVILLIFIPIAIGFSIFGWYSIKGLYGKLPENGMEVE